VLPGYGRTTAGPAQGYGKYGLILAGLDMSHQQVVRGVIIILAVALARRT
jgi:hypothetical protein